MTYLAYQTASSVGTSVFAITFVALVLAADGKSA